MLTIIISVLSNMLREYVQDNMWVVRFLIIDGGKEPNRKWFMYVVMCPVNILPLYIKQMASESWINVIARPAVWLMSDHPSCFLHCSKFFISAEVTMHVSSLYTILEPTMIFGNPSYPQQRSSISWTLVQVFPSIIHSPPLI